MENENFQQLKSSRSEGLGLPSSPCNRLVPLFVPSIHVPRGEWPQHRGGGLSASRPVFWRDGTGATFYDDLHID